MPIKGLVNKQTGEALANARKKKGLTQEEMAEVIRVALKRKKFTPRQYQNYEAGEFPIYKTEVIKQIDKILGTSFYELIYATNIQSKETNNDHEKYVKLLERDRDFFQTALEISLNEISRNQLILLSQQYGVIKTAAEIYSKNDPKKMDKVLQDVGKYAGQYTQGDAKTDNSDGN